MSRKKDNLLTPVPKLVKRCYQLAGVLSIGLASVAWADAPRAISINDTRPSVGTTQTKGVRLNEQIEDELQPAAAAAARRIQDTARKIQHRPPTFVAWCQDPMLEEEPAITISRVLNTLGAHSCEEAVEMLKRSPTLIIPPQGQKIADLRPIGALTWLKTLQLPNNRIIDISPLRRLHDLENLSLRRNAIIDIKPLVGLKKLRRLDVSGNEIRDLTPLKQLPALVMVRNDLVRPVDETGEASNFH